MTAFTTGMATRPLAITLYFSCVVKLTVGCDSKPGRVIEWIRSSLEEVAWSG